MPAQISPEVVALLEQAETATVGHWRHWGFCDRRIVPALRGRRIAGTAVTVAAKAAGAKAGVVDGPCTDLEEIEASAFPMWSRGFAPITTRLYDLGGRLNRPVSIGGVVVMPGDAVLCDDSGVLVLPPAEAEAEARQAIAKQASGLVTQQRVAAGAKLGDLSGATAMVLK